MKKSLPVLLILMILSNGKLIGQSLSKNTSSYEIGGIKAQGPSDEGGVLNSFAGSINTLFNQDQAGLSFDLSLETYHYFIVLGKKKENVKIKRKSDGFSDLDVIRNKYIGINFYLLNRASVNFDSIQNIANDYLTSLQSSPLTLRLNKEFFLTKNKVITEDDYSPVASFIITGDLRAVPYGDVSDKVQLGASGHLFFSFSGLLKRIEFDPEGKEVDKGTMYFQPSFGLAFGTNKMMENVFLDGENKILLSSELRVGFKSDENRIKDWGLLARYTWEDISGPNFRIGITVASQ